jgi:hypothetical protein
VHNGGVLGRLVWVTLLGWSSVAGAAGGIAVEVADHGCPGRGQIVAALEARLPGVTGAGAGRRLEVERGPDAVMLRLRQGEVLELERRLDERGTSTEGCEALAETAALVVVRYLREIGYRPPAREPPAAAAVVATPAVAAPAAVRVWEGYLGVAAGGRAGGAARGESVMVFQLHRGWFAGELAAGATTETSTAVPGAAGAELRVRSFPVRVLLGTRLRLGPGVLVPAAGAGLELLWFRATGLDDARRGLRVEPAAELGLSYLLAGRRSYVRVGAGGGLTLGAHDFDAGVGAPVFRTPGAYLRAQVEVGLVLWKNYQPASL